MKIHLIGVGEHEAIPARDVKAGDIMICNYGMTQVVEAVEFSESGKSVFFRIRCGEKVYSRCRFKADRLVAVVRVNGGAVCRFM